MNDFVVIILALVCAVATLAYSGLLSLSVLKLPGGNSKMQEIALAIQAGSNTYLSRQTQALTTVGAFTFVLLWASLDGFKFPFVALCFAGGAILSVIVGIISLNMALSANLRSAQAAEKGLSEALDVAFKGGSVSGLVLVGMALLGVAGFYLLYVDLLGQTLEQYLKAMIGFGLGACLISLFSRISGGIYSKGADVGAAFIKSLPARLSDNDLRNPVCIADKLGDQVGDGVGTSSDLFETYSVTLIVTMLLGSLAFAPFGEEAILLATLYPLALAASAMLASVIGSWFVKLRPGSHKIMGALYKGSSATVLLSALSFFFVTRVFFPVRFSGIFAATLIGLALMLLLMAISDYYTSTTFKPIKFVAEQAEYGAAANLSAGLALGLQSTLAPVGVICVGLLAAYQVVGGGSDNHLIGIYGIAVAATALLSSSGIVGALNGFGTIADHASGIAEMADLPAESREITDALDTVGNTTRTIAKVYAIGSAGLLAPVLFVCYSQQIDLYRLQNLHLQPVAYLLSDPLVLVGLLSGGMLPFLFSSLLMNSVAKTAAKVFKEARRQLDEIPGLLAGTSPPEYDSCGEILTRAALKEMIRPGLLAMTIPILVGFTLGPRALGGLLIGAIVSGLLLALFTTIAGTSWNTAKKYLEMGYFGGKDSDAHTASLVGDSVGDPFKDSAGPALNPLIKTLNLIALLIATLLAGGGLFGL